MENLITVDIGGTSADICLIAMGEIGPTQTGRVGPWPLSVPMVDMVTIGAGAPFAGPAIVTQLDATALLGAGWMARMDASGALLPERD